MLNLSDIEPELLIRLQKVAEADGISLEDAISRAITRGLDSLAEEDTEEFIRKFYPDRVDES